MNLKDYRDFQKNLTVIMMFYAITTGEWSGICDTDKPLHCSHFRLPSMNGESDKRDEVEWEITSWLPHFNIPEIGKVYITAVLDPGIIS